MLALLRIKNLALADDVSVELDPGYVAITGETGAGKSILIGALGLVLGERADRTMIRSGSDQCSVEAIFDVRRIGDRIGAVLADNGVEPCEGSQLVIKRSIAASGSNRQFVNGSPTTLQVLVQLGDWLVDLHGPHDHQSLLHPARQLEMVDAFGGLHPSVAEVARRVRERREIEAELAELTLDPAARARELDLLRHQVNEIEAARLDSSEEEALEPEYQRAQNAARLLEAGRRALQILAEDEASMLNSAGALGRSLQELQRIDPDAACLMSLHEQAVSSWRDLQTDLTVYVERLDLDPERLARLEERMDLLRSLKRKYGGSLADVLSFGAEAREKMERLEHGQEALAELERRRAAAEAEILRAGRALSRLRAQVLPRLVKSVRGHLAGLGFERGEFEIALRSSGEASQASERGLDAVEFQFSPNAGEPLKPLRAIASSGEMARVMLALKTALAAQDSVPVLVFDEVDANVGGETAARVGEKMREIGKERQVLCITHLAPVAAQAACHLRVAKRVVGGRTLTSVDRLSPAERKEELARMLGGTGDAARRHAQALLDARSGG